MANNPYLLALLQMQCSANKQANLENALAMLEDAAKQGAKVALLPELFLGQYFCQVHDAEYFKLAESFNGATIQIIQDVAKRLKLVVLVSLFEQARVGMCFNGLVVIKADGNIGGKYRKMHIPHDPQFYEKYYFTNGDLGYQAVATEVGTIGTLICWDQWFPEAARLTAMQGAELLCYPTAIGWQAEEKEMLGEAQRDAWITVQRGHAIANGVYVAACNRVGVENVQGSELEFWGSSFIVDPMGRVIAEASREKEEIILAEINPEFQQETRLAWPFFRDRRVDSYGGLVQR